MRDAALVFLAALATAVATGAGALPLALDRHRSERWLGLANAAACGVMLGASASLVLEGASWSGSRTGLGVAAGAIFVAVASRLVDKREALALGPLRGADARTALLVVGVMTIHSAAEGVGVGAAFGNGAAFGGLIAAAIAVHNVPEGLAISLVLVPRGTRVRSAAGWSIFSSLPQPLLAVPAFLFVEQFGGVLPIGLGFAAGAMMWMVALNLLPDALRYGSRTGVVAVVLVSFGAMLAVQLGLTS